VPGKTALGESTVWRMIEPREDKTSNVKKIVILGGSSEEGVVLNACLRLLFPECEIQIQPREEKNTKEEGLQSLE
jgi:hypothetical protein